MKSLAAMQEWLLQAIQHPSGTSDAAKMVRGAYGTLTPVDRLEIYGRSFHGRLLQVLEGEYPALRHAMGQELFLQFAGEYLRAYPPDTYTLQSLGQNFPTYLRETRPIDSSELWPEFLIDLATLERTFSEVYQADGPENHDLTPSTESDQISQEPWTQTLTFQFPVHEFFLTFKTDSEADLILTPRPCTLLVYRRDYRVRIRER